MKAKNISGQAPGGKRTKLADVLPLKTPFVIQIFPIYTCNFSCNYCIFSVDKAKRGFISDKIIMDFDLYKKCIDDIAKFPSKVKVLRFVGIGEPLLHKNIGDMIKYANSKNIANIVELLTNGSLLTPETSKSLISAGLSRLVISLQGTTKEHYQKISGVNIDFKTFIENLKYDKDVIKIGEEFLVRKSDIEAIGENVEVLGEIKEGNEAAKKESSKKENEGEANKEGE